MVEVEEATLKKIGNDLRDIINWIKVWNQEEAQGATKKIEDTEANQLIEKLKEIAGILEAEIL